MRAGEDWHCAKCGIEGVGRTDLCQPSCAEARDENGNAPPLPLRVSVERLLRSESRYARVHLIQGVFHPVFTELALAVRQIRSRRRLKARLRECGDTAAPIGEAAEGLCRIEGRVRVLTPAHRTGAAPPHPIALGAYIWREAEESTRDAVTTRRITTHRACGRFLVEDDSGVALVDDDYLELRDFHGHEPEPFEPGGIVVEDGALVTVLGRARRGSVELPADARVGTGYRDRALPLIFDGSSNEPLVVFAEPAG